MQVNSSDFVTPLYLDFPDTFKHKAQVTSIGKDEIKKKSYYWIQLNETIFHPQGGGQLSDIGTIDGIPVDYVHKLMLGNKNQFQIQHCFTQNVNFKIGQIVELEVNADNRFINSRWHTAAHVVGHLVEKKMPSLIPFGGQCFPSDAYMKFKATSEDKLPTAAELAEICKPEVVKSFQQMIEDKPLKIIQKDNGIRELQIADYAPVGCGGTHIHSLKQLGELVIGPCKITKKEATVSVKYSLK